MSHLDDRADRAPGREELGTRLDDLLERAHVGRVDDDRDDVLQGAAWRLEYGAHVANGLSRLLRHVAAPHEISVSIAGELARQEDQGLRVVDSDEVVIDVCPDVLQAFRVAAGDLRHRQSSSSEEALLPYPARRDWHTIAVHLIPHPGELSGWQPRTPSFPPTRTCWSRRISGRRHSRGDTKVISPRQSRAFRAWQAGSSISAARGKPHGWRRWSTPTIRTVGLLTWRRRARIRFVDSR